MRHDTRPGLLPLHQSAHSSRADARADGIGLCVQEFRHSLEDVCIRNLDLSAKKIQDSGFARCFKSRGLGHPRLALGDGTASSCALTPVASVHLREYFVSTMSYGT
jgi:hypothetical protein